MSLIFIWILHLNVQAERDKLMIKLDHLRYGKTFEEMDGNLSNQVPKI
jgi:hypothetical protein